AGIARAGGRARRWRPGGRAVPRRPPRRRLRAGARSGRPAARGDPAADVRRRDPSRDRLPRDRPGDREGEAKGRDREVLRRQHKPQAQAPREAEGGKEADEAGRRGRGAPGGLPGGAQPERREEVVAPPPVRESWALAVPDALVGIRGVLVGQLVPNADTYELVLTTRESPPASELVELLSERL